MAAGQLIPRADDVAARGDRGARAVVGLGDAFTFHLGAAPGAALVSAKAGFLC